MQKKKDNSSCGNFIRASFFRWTLVHEARRWITLYRQGKVGLGVSSLMVINCHSITRDLFRPVYIIMATNHRTQKLDMQHSTIQSIEYLLNCTLSAV